MKDHPKGWACRRCVHWNNASGLPDEHDDVQGQCQRHAPRPIIDKEQRPLEQLFPVWPETFGDYWCGEFRAVDQ